MNTLSPLETRTRLYRMAADLQTEAELGEQLGETVPMPGVVAELRGDVAFLREVGDQIAEEALTRPDAVTVLDRGGHRFLVAPTGEAGFNSERPRQCVVCLTCEKLLHANTTGADSRIRDHLQGRP